MKRILFLTLLIATLFPSNIYAQSQGLILANDVAITTSAVISADEWFGQSFFFRGTTTWTVTEFSFRYGSAAKVGTTAGIYEMDGGVPNINLPFCATTSGAWALDEEGGAHDWWFFDLTALDCDGIAPFTEYALLIKNDAVGLDWQQAKYNDTDPFADGTGFDEVGGPAGTPLPGTPEGDFLFRIYGFERTVAVPSLFLFAYVGLTMIGLSLLLSVCGSPMIGIIAVNAIVFLMAIGLEWIPSYMLIVVMMGVGLIILMSNRRETQGN